MDTAILSSNSRMDGKAAANAAQSGFDALRRGDARRARELFEHAVADGQETASVQIGVAYACRSLHDAAGMANAVDRALALDPRNLHALILKGDSLAQAGDARGAASFYRAAVSGAPPLEQLGAELRRELTRARQLCDAY